MARIVVGKFSRSKNGTAVTQKRVRDAATGRHLTVRTIDGGSKTLGQDLSYVFGRNVAKARRENKAVTDVADRAPTPAEA
jgi:hypothetical protein